MEKTNSQVEKPENKKAETTKLPLKRRTLLKALAGVPVLGAFCLPVIGKTGI